MIFCGNNLHRAFTGILTHVVLLFLPMAVSWPPFHPGFAQAGSTTAQELPRGGKWAFMFTFTQATFCFCVGYFSYYCDKTPDRSNLRKECWLWLRVWRCSLRHGWKGGNSSIRHLGHILIQEHRHECWCSAYFLLFIQTRWEAVEMVLNVSYFLKTLPSTLRFPWCLPNRQAVKMKVDQKYL